VTRVRHRGDWPERARLGEEGDCQEGDQWYARGTPQEASVRHARILAAINAGARGEWPRQEAEPDRGPLADAIRERVFAALAGREEVRGVFVQFVTCSRRGPRVRVRAWLDTAAIVTIERDNDGEAASPTCLAAEIVVAVDRATRLQESDPDGARVVGGAPCRP
jgi:hypothetical protein